MTNITNVTAPPPAATNFTAVSNTATTTSDATTQATSSASTKSSGAVTFNPRLYEDPSAGGVVITEYLSANGSTISQFPSTAVIAYLREGLTASGQQKTEATNEVKPLATVA